eukprot:scaffold736_cov254-Pinguiococcus_pyrenoidosus.AAC.34
MGRLKQRRIPHEARVENLPRERHTAAFHNALLAFRIEAGRDGRNAVLTEWLDAVGAHDDIVVKVEALMKQVREARRVFQRQRRFVKNLSGLWMVTNDRPHELREYEELQGKNLVACEAKDPKERAQLELDLQRVGELRQRSERLLELRSGLEDAQEELENRRRRLSALQKQLDEVCEKEKELAGRISHDHVVALDRGCSLPAVFPNVQLGYCVTKVNDIACEDVAFEDIRELLASSASPQTVEFRRYDYRRVGLRDAWLSLAELRDAEIYVEDARRVMPRRERPR